MKPTCGEHRARALDYVLGDLAVLERTRMEAHVGRCEQCAELVQRLGDAFQAAKTWPPAAEPRDLENLISRLEPYFGADEPKVSRISGFTMAILAAAAATAAIIFAANYSKDQEPFAPAPEIVRFQPRPFVRVVAGGGWDGKVGGESGEATSIVMSRGFAVIDFEGGEGRKLLVGAPNAAIEVIGTRFFVETAAGGLTTVGVISGRVDVGTERGRETISAGEEKTFGTGGSVTRGEQEPSPAESYAEDPFLGTHVTVAVKAPEPPKPAKRAAAVRAAPVDPLSELAAAQRLARSGEPRAALEKYDVLLARLASSGGALFSLARYERARLLYFTLGEQARGELELRAIAVSSAGEASIQAKLSLCEIRVAADRCAAASCLEELRVREHASLGPEIDRLFRSWNLSGESACVNK